MKPKWKVDRSHPAIIEDTEHVLEIGEEESSELTDKLVRICLAVNNHDALVAACKHAVKSEHHKKCPRLKGARCTCHVGKARDALDGIVYERFANARF